MPAKPPPERHDPRRRAPSLWRALGIALAAFALAAAFVAIGRIVDPLTTAGDRPAPATADR